MTDEEFAERLRAVVLRAVHEWGYIDFSIVCGVNTKGDEYHNHEEADELVADLLDVDAAMRA